MDLNSEYSKWLVELWNSPERWAIANAGGWAAYYSRLAAMTLPTDAAAVAVVGTIALPVITMVGVFVALGSGYAAARDLARNENTASGFSQGFVTGLLGWEWRHTADRLGRRYLVIDSWDEAMDSIRVKYYNGGLKAGWVAAKAFNPSVGRAYLTKLRKASGVQIPGDWSAHSGDEAERLRARHVQTSYVIDLAATGLRYNIIRPE